MAYRIQFGMKVATKQQGAPIPIDLSRPRDFTSPRFNQTKRRILDLLRSERANSTLEAMDHQ
jgi:hypothetical protein